MFKLTYLGNGSYNFKGFTFMKGKTIEVSEEAFKHLRGPLFKGKKTNDKSKYDVEKDIEKPKEKSKKKGK